jgi:hypothetical protein
VFENEREGPMIISKVNDITVGVLEPKTNTTKSMARNIKIIVASKGVIHKHL